MQEEPPTTYQLETGERTFVKTTHAVIRHLNDAVAVLSRLRVHPRVSKFEVILLAARIAGREANMTWTHSEKAKPAMVSSHFGERPADQEVNETAQMAVELIIGLGMAEYGHVQARESAVLMAVWQGWSKDPLLLVPGSDVAEAIWGEVYSFNERLPPEVRRPRRSFTPDSV